MGEEPSSDILSDSTHQIYSPKFMYTPGEGLYQSCIRIVKFQILDFWQFSFVLFFGV